MAWSMGLLGASVGLVDSGAYDLLETTILDSSASSVSFTGLGSYTGYKHLQVRSVQTGTGFGSGAVELFAQFNADTSASYAHHRLVGNGSSVSSNGASSVTAIFAGFVGADFPTATVMDILDPFSTSKNTTVRCLSGGLTGPDEIHLNSGLYNNTSAITSVQLFPRSGGSFVAGSRFSLYGIKDS